MKHVKFIVAVGKDGSIGRNGNLIWKISEDLKHFRLLTTGSPVIMGRKTWESLPKKPLPNRLNIILTHQNDYAAPGAQVADSPEKALDLCGTQTPFIIGGAQIYEAFLPYCTQIYLTEVNSECRDADTFLHLDLQNGWEPSFVGEWNTNPEGLGYRFVELKRAE